MTLTKKATFKTIEVDRIDPDPEQPRKEFSEAELKELGDSLVANGQLQAIAVRYHKTTRRYTIVVGERRWRAAQAKGLETLNAQVFDIDDDRAFEMQIAENVNRVDMTPMEEARAYDQLRRRGWSVERIAAAYGKGEPYVQWRIDLLNLNDAAKELVEKGQLPVNTAWYVCRLDADTQHRFLVKWARGDMKSARDAEEFARACKHVEAQGGFFTLDPAEHTEEVQEKVATERRRVVSRIEKLAVAGEILSELAETDPVELAKILGGAEGGVCAYQDRVLHLRAVAGRATTALRKAAAIVAAATVELNPEALTGDEVADEPAADDQAPPVGAPDATVLDAEQPDQEATEGPTLRLVTDDDAELVDA